MPRFDRKSFLTIVGFLGTILFQIQNAQAQTQTFSSDGRLKIGPSTDITSVRLEKVNPEWLVKFHPEMVRALPDFRTRNNFIYVSDITGKYSAVVWNHHERVFANYYRMDEFYSVYKAATSIERKHLAPIMDASQYEKDKYIAHLDAKFRQYGNVALLHNAFNSESDYLAFIFEYHTVDLRAGTKPWFIFDGSVAEERNIRSFSHTYNTVQRRLRRLIY